MELQYVYLMGVVLLTIVLIVGLIIKERNNSPEEKAQYETWHNDPANWRWYFFYYNPLDKRIFPPKRIAGLGWTVNFANAYSVLVVIGIIFLALIPAVLKLFFEY